MAPIVVWFSATIVGRGLGILFASTSRVAQWIADCFEVPRPVERRPDVHVATESSLDKLMTSRSSLGLRLSYAAVGACAALACLGEHGPVRAFGWHFGIAPAAAAQKAKLDDSPASTVRALCGAVLDGTGRQVTHLRAGGQTSTSASAHCGSSDTQPKPAQEHPAPISPKASDSAPGSRPDLQHQTRWVQASAAKKWRPLGTVMQYGSALRY